MSIEKLNEKYHLVKITTVKYEKFNSIYNAERRVFEIQDKIEERKGIDLEEISVDLMKMTKRKAA